MNDIYEFLESKKMSASNINKIYMYYYRQNKDYDFVERLNGIYDVLYYINLNDYEIEKLLSHNLKIINMNTEELFKLAYVLKFCDYNERIFDLNDHSILQYLSNYKRLFMRTILYNKILKKATSPSALLERETGAYGDQYNITGLIRSASNCFVTSDKELESFLNSILKVDSKPITVDEFILKGSQKLRANYMLTKIKARKNDRSI